MEYDQPTDADWARSSADKARELAEKLEKRLVDVEVMLGISPCPYPLLPPPPWGEAFAARYAPFLMTAEETLW